MTVMTGGPSTAIAAAAGKRVRRRVAGGRSAAATVAAPRRTQQERREGTIRKLLDAAAETLIHVGYAEASVQRICARAVLSQGALFRHFATREALMVAVGQDVGAQLLARFRKKFVARPDGENDALVGMRLVREACRSQLNHAWHELTTAARTNPTLRKALGPVARDYVADMTRLARELLPDLATLLGSQFEVLVSTVILTFDGEAIHRAVLSEPGVEEARLEMLGAAVARLARNG